ncbi:MAG: 3'-5' exonuclease [Terracidiphilus sp.]|nr:3'-5' exonuclease [Terracidiphilus sp.]
MTQGARVDYCVVDVETANQGRQSICQIGIALFAGGRMVDGWESLVDPEEHFSGFNISIHGIHPETVAGAPTWAEVLPSVRKLLGGAAVASHTAFDRGAMELACLKVRKPAIPYRKWLDTCTLARAAFPELPNHKLPTLARCLGFSYKAHDALEDARIAGEVLALALARRGVTVAELLATPQQHIGAFPKAPVKA